jgi:alpha-tubulin suppressor-like RCC1 family protein
MSNKTNRPKSNARSGNTARVRTAHTLLVSALPTWLLVVASGCAGQAVDVEEVEPTVVDQQALAKPIDEFPNSIVKPPITKPVPTYDPEEFIEISAGAYHTCARKRGGKLYCWGRNDTGQVGVDSYQTTVARPTKVSSFSGFTSAASVELGYDHTCALDPQGIGYCWGNSNYGQLGIPYNQTRSIPTAVNVGFTFTSLSAGTSRTCGTNSAGLYCWGAGISLPSGNAGVGVTPQIIWSATGLAPIGVTVGDGHVCALWVSGSTRETNCGGLNSFGQSGATTGIYSAIGQGPSDVGTSVKRVVSQSNFTCVERTDPIPNVQCFGDNSHGQLGNGTFTSSVAAQTVGGVSGMSNTPNFSLRGVSTGQQHACAIDTSSNAYCWGEGAAGRLGTGNQSDALGPTLVIGGLRFKAVAAGYLHSCAIGTDNALYCWGDNAYGQLGTGTPGGWIASPLSAVSPQS